MTVLLSVLCPCSADDVDFRESDSLSTATMTSAFLVKKVVPLHRVQECIIWIRSVDQTERLQTPTRKLGGMISRTGATFSNSRNEKDDVWFFSDGFALDRSQVVCGYHFCSRSFEAELGTGMCPSAFASLHSVAQSWKRQITDPDVPTDDAAATA